MLEKAKGPKSSETKKMCLKADYSTTFRQTYKTFRLLSDRKLNELVLD